MKQVIISMPENTTRLQMALEGEKECIMKRSRSITSVHMNNMKMDRLKMALFDISYDVLLVLSQPFSSAGRFSFIDLKDMLGLPEQYNLYFRGMQVTPLKSGWDGSSAARIGVFDLDAAGDKMRFYLQYLPPNSETIKHYHRMIHETYVSLAGEEVWVGDKSLSNDLVLQVAPGIGNFHQVRTGNNPALMLLCMDPDLGYSDYHYEDKRRFDGKLVEVL